MENPPSESIDAVLEELTIPEPLELMNVEFRRTAIIGVGLIGGSIGLRMKAMDHPGEIVGHDLADVLDEALLRGAIDRGAGDLSEAVSGADLVILATPVDETVRLLPTVLKIAKPGAIVTDTAPTKAELARLAAEVKGTHAIFCGGHPLAGSNRQGISAANPDLFVSAYYLFTPLTTTPPASMDSLKWWARWLGAYPMTLEPELHDWIMARTTHLPFVLALALSVWVDQQGERSTQLLKLTTGNFQSLTAMASLPLQMWEAVMKSNSKQVAEALREFRTVLDQCEAQLEAGRLAEIWKRAYAFQKTLARERPGDWDAQCELLVTVADRPGAIARIASLLGSVDINIRDIAVLHIRERVGGTLRVVLETRSQARRALDLLIDHGFGARFKEQRP